MNVMRPLSFPTSTLLAFLMAGAGTAAAQQMPDKVLLPWQKPQPTARAPANFTEILPWLIPEGSKAKAQDAGANWQPEVAAPKDPIEPVVVEPVAKATRLETGGIEPSGLVLKKPPINVKNDTKSAIKATPINSKAGDAAAPDAPAPKLKTDTTPAGDSVVTPKANVVSPGAAEFAQRAEAEEARPAMPALTEPAGGNEAAQPAHKPPGATAVPPAAGRPEIAQDAGVPPVEAAPTMPLAEEAPPIPDALPEAVVTPVAKPATPDLSEQRSKDLPAAQPAQPDSAATAGAEAVAQSKPRAPERLVDGANVAQQYCFNIADAAKDARYAWQKKTLADIELELNKRIALLDQRTAEYQKWLARRDEFIRNAEDNVVKIYAGMKVDASATQLALMNEEAAAAVLSKLNTRNASAILNEMEPGKAARLTMIITGAAKLKRKREMETSPATQGADAVPGTPVAAGGRS